MYIPTTFAVSQSLGRRPSLRDFRNISVKSGANSRLHSFSTVFGIRSGPLALLPLSITSGLRWHRLLNEAYLVGYMAQWVQVLGRHLS